MCVGFRRISATGPEGRRRFRPSLGSRAVQHIGRFVLTQVRVQQRMPRLLCASANYILIRLALLISSSVPLELSVIPELILLGLGLLSLSFRSSF